MFFAIKSGDAFDLSEDLFDVLMCLVRDFVFLEVVSDLGGGHCVVLLDCNEVDGVGRFLVGEGGGGGVGPVVV